MLCMITASFRETATVAFLMPLRFMMRKPQARTAHAFVAAPEQRSRRAEER